MRLKLYFHIFLVFAVGLIGNGHPQFSCVKQRENIVIPKISLARDRNVLHHFCPAARNLTEVYQQISFGLDRNDLVISLITVLVTSDHFVVHIFQYNTEICSSRMEFWTQFLGIAGELFYIETRSIDKLVDICSLGTLLFPVVASL